ncbi:MAG: hypothetical protein HYZ01_14475 [Ignavibacteriales bacterium]|nr:hypothetical protein [Ignavibacteriales bacterium]
MLLRRGMVVLAAMGVALIGAQAQAPPTAAQILLNVEQRGADVRDYIVDVQAEVDMERMRIPRMKATMYFKRPNKVHVESPSFAMLPREGLALDPAAMREQYDVSLVGVDDTAGIKIYKLQLAAKAASTRLRQMFVWVNGGHWTIMKMETIPYQGRVLTMLFTYALFEGKYWLPQSMKVEFEAPGRDTTGVRSDPAIAPSPQWDEMRRPLRSGSISLVYANYRINTGLGDEMFEGKESQRRD